LQFASATTQAKNCKRVCLANAQSELALKPRKTKQDVESQLTTMYKNNSDFIAKTKVCIYNKGLCLTVKLVHFNPLLFLVCQESAMALNWLHAVDKMMVDPSESLYRRWL